MTELNHPLLIRPMCPGDLDCIFSMRSRPHGEEWLMRQERSEVYVAVAELEGIPVGRVGLDFTQHVNQEGEAFLFSAHVEPDYQSRGIGTSLFLHLEQVARRRDCNAIRLDVGKGNPRAQRLYERLGYQVCGEEIARWSDRVSDRMVEMAEDCWMMRKTL